MSERENLLLTEKHVLVCLPNHDAKFNDVQRSQLDYLKNHFCGIVVSDPKDLKNTSEDCIVYLTGNMEEVFKLTRIGTLVIELSYNYEESNAKKCSVGQVPIHVHKVGIYVRDFFPSKGANDCDLITCEHKFQLLTESNKPSHSFRKGIYLSEVKQLGEEEYSFHLLRCSTNLNGPTENFRTTDLSIINKVNLFSQDYFKSKTDLNHVLAQVYENTTLPRSKAQRKACIPAHSDKTKDMPKEGLIAFCTFYKDYVDGQFKDEKLKQVKRSPEDLYDHCYKTTSVLTRLRFKLKDEKLDRVKQFDVTLYPNSVFIMSLSSNRLYTHQIVPSVLPVDKIPTRLGYVIRCSKTCALYKKNQTFVCENDKLIPLEKPDHEGIKQLKRTYLKENTTDEEIQYEPSYFSLNNGDYTQPLL